MFLAGDDPNPSDFCYRKERLEILGRALSRLEGRQRQIVSLYNKQGITMRQDAKLLNVHESRISQLHSAALIGFNGNVDSVPDVGQAEGSGTWHSVVGCRWQGLMQVRQSRA